MTSSWLPARVPMAPVPAPPTRPPDCDAPTTAPAPASMPITDSAFALVICWRRRARWPPAIWPVSWASTPMISFGVSASMSAPTLTKIFCPLATKALKERSLTRTILSRLGADAGGAEDRPRIVAQELLGFGIAHHRRLRAALGRRRQGRPDQESGRKRSKSGCDRGAGQVRHRIVAKGNGRRRSIHVPRGG